MKTMSKRSGRLPGMALLTLFLAFSPGITARAGDSLYGKVTAVKRANLITLDYGAGTYDIRLAGVDLPRERVAAQKATQFVSKMLLNKHARLRFDGRTAQGEMVGKIFTDDKEIGIKDVGVEMVRAGMALRQRGYTGYRYNELVAAEAAAKKTQRGIWAKSPDREKP